MAFNNCPVELIQEIGMYLSDQDIASFRLVCQACRAGIDGDFDRFWVYRFRDTYDPSIAQLNRSEIKTLYQKRRMWQRKAPKFSSGTTQNEKACLEVIKGIILDARPFVDDFETPECLNFNILSQFIANTNLLDCIYARTRRPQQNSRRADRSNPLILIQLVLSAQSLNFIRDEPKVLAFEESQKAAYMSTVAAPLFDGYNGLAVNVEWALHTVNFFRNHLLRSQEQTLYDAYKALDRSSLGLDLPQYWKERLSDADNDAPIGPKWKGTYSYLERSEVSMLRQGEPGSNIFMDRNVDLGAKAIQSLDVSFPDEPMFAWPEIFEQHLESTTWIQNRSSNQPRTRAQIRQNGPLPALGLTRRFEGTGYDDEIFSAMGWINPLPPQNGIPGWKRLTMMKFFIENDVIDLDALWAYEGVVLPGGQVIVGRWWSADALRDRENMYSGPFILWNTEAGARLEEAREMRKRERAEVNETSLTAGLFGIAGSSSSSGTASFPL